MTLQSHEADGGFDSSGGAQEMADAGFGGADGEMGAVGAGPTGDGEGFGRIIEGCAGSMGIEIINLGRIDPSVSCCLVHGSEGGVSLGMRLGQMMHISSGAIADDLSEHCRMPILG